MGRLAGKVAIVTGGASGIGLAIVRRFREEGATVEVLEREAGEDQIACDVTDAARVEAVVDEIRARRGRIDILVNNAGIAHVGNALTTSAEDFERVQRVNVFGPANCLRAVLRHMVADGGGVVLKMVDEHPLLAGCGAFVA